jgi:hypothetical protein
MNPNRFSLQVDDRLTGEQNLSPQAFMAVPACLLVATPCAASYQSQLYAWAFAQAKAAHAPPAKRTPELFGIFN